jgi:hypothetical protein
MLCIQDVLGSNLILEVDQSWSGHWKRGKSLVSARNQTPVPRLRKYSSKMENK